MKKMNKAEALENAWKAFENRENALMNGVQSMETSEALTKALTYVNKNGWSNEWKLFFEEKNKGNEWWR